MHVKFMFFIKYNDVSGSYTLYVVRDQYDRINTYITLLVETFGFFPLIRHKP